MTLKGAAGAIALVLGACAAGQVAAQPSAQAVRAAWAGEDAYWRAQQAGDDAAYARLFHPRFTGWPCNSATPVSGGSRPPRTTSRVAGTTVATTLDEKAQTGGADYVQVYYRATTRLVEPDGRARTLVRNFTHVWAPDGGTWKIIGGMCRNDDAAVK